ncbi:MAG: DUF4127 family protein [Mycoplasmatales bacterium]
MKIKILPLDERPCNIRFGEKICSYNNKIELISPNLNILGKKKAPGNFKKINEYIFNNNSEYLIISLDTYLYGGLLPSRLHQMSFDVLLSKLQKLKSLKSKNPDLKIYAFSTIMRTPRYNSSDEEPDYYSKFGSDIFLKKYLEDKKDCVGLSKDEKLNLKGIKIPMEFEQDYQKRRDTNLKVNLEIVKLLADNTFEYLIFPQDDSAPYGYTRIDQNEVYSSLKQLNPKRYSVHPGADEVLMTLISRIYNYEKNVLPKVFIKFENDEFKKCIPLYEDRNIEKTLNLHLEAAGFVETKDLTKADKLLYYNVPQDKEMIESFDQDLKLSKKFDLSLFENKDFFILDNCYANGGDISLLKSLKNHNLIDNVLGYSGWNTNANSLGTILCMMSVSDNVNNGKLKNFIYERFLEDGLYQAIIRKKISLKYLEELGLTYFDLKDMQNVVIEKELKEFEELCDTILGLKEFEIKLSHPWNRMFEIDIDVVVKWYYL